MKRLLLSVFAAALTAAVAVPAMATTFSFDGQYRARGEYRGNPGFVDSAESSGVLQRVRLTTNADITSDTSVKITLQDSAAWGMFDPMGRGGPALTDVGGNHLDLHEAFVKVNNVFGQPVSLKIGRQELVYGDQRLIGAFGWNNNGRSFDAIKANWANSAVSVDAFASKISESTGSFGTNCTGGCGGDGDQDFYGIYATIKSIPHNTLDAYVLYLRDGSGATAFGQTTLGNTAITGTPEKASNLYTYGVRLKGNYSGVDYTLELPFQSGSVDTNTSAVSASAGTGTSYDIGSWAFAAKAGYTLPTAMKIRLGAEYVTAQGDDDGGAGGDTDVETFFNLFPTNHGHMGIMDQQGWRNVDAWALNATGQVTSKLKLYLAFWNFELNEEKDAWYGAAQWNNPGAGIRAASSTNTESDVGTELDFVATYKYNSALTAQLGLARFFTGKFLEQAGRVNSTGNVDDMDFAYLQLIANF
ncbi:MAG: alginate export family protein [Thermodesulfobacteriota bacterium]